MIVITIIRATAEESIQGLLKIGAGSEKAIPQLLKCYLFCSPIQRERRMQRKRKSNCEEKCNKKNELFRQFLYVLKKVNRTKRKRY